MEKIVPTYMLDPEVAVSIPPKNLANLGEQLNLWLSRASPEQLSNRKKLLTEHSTPDSNTPLW